MPLASNASHRETRARARAEAARALRPVALTHLLALYNLFELPFDPLRRDVRHSSRVVRAVNSTLSSCRPSEIKHALSDVSLYVVAVSRARCI